LDCSFFTFAWQAKLNRAIGDILGYSEKTSHRLMAQDVATPLVKDAIWREWFFYVSPNPDIFGQRQRATYAMQLTNYKSTAEKGTGISFPKLESWNALSRVATIAATVNKRRVLCRISLQILQDKFGASETEPMRTVAEHRMVIQEAAQNLIEREAFEEDGSVLIQAGDI
jgi:hypothetical protein